MQPQLFTAAKVAHLSLLPQGQAERYTRVEATVERMEEYFGSCTKTTANAKKHARRREISIVFIAVMNREHRQAKRVNPNAIAALVATETPWRLKMAEVSVH